MKHLAFSFLLLVAGAACDVAGQRPVPPEEEPVATAEPEPAPEAVQIQPGTVCARFATKLGGLAQRYPTDAAAFLGALHTEFVGGSGDPFAMKQALKENRWNQRYFYAGHGGFRPEYDDARRAYRDGGNHQPGHFVSVLSVATQFGADAARLAIAEAGDYNPEEEDDLRLSGVAIRLGSGLADGSLQPPEVARQVRELCR